MMAPKTVTLSNGTEELQALVALTMLHLKQLSEPESFIVLFDFAALAHDPTYSVFQPSKEKLIALALLDSNGMMHDSTRNIVRCATEVDLEAATVVTKDPR